MQTRKTNPVLDWFRGHANEVPNSDETPPPVRHGLDHADHTPTAAPHDLRELIKLFSNYDAAKGISVLVQDIDFHNVNPRQVYYSVHGRPPEKLKAALPDVNYSAEKHFLAAVQSDEFQSRVIAHFLNAFPEKRRILFVHIPKCAGSDLRHHLTPKFLTLPHQLTSEEWVKKEELFEALRDAVLAVDRSLEIFVHGHIELDRYLAAVPGRVGDRIVTVIRDPVEIAVSQANYAMTLLVKDPGGTRPDSRRNLELLGLERLPEDADPEALKALAIRAFRDPRITRPNLICQHLASGRRGHRDAIRNIILHDIEVTDTAHYKAWLHDAWGIQSESRKNVSTVFLTREDVSSHSEYLRELTSEDQRVFDLISWALSEHGSSAIRGSDLLSMVNMPGPYVLDADHDEIVLASSREIPPSTGSEPAQAREPPNETEKMLAGDPAAAPPMPAAAELVAPPKSVQTIAAPSAPTPAPKAAVAASVPSLDQLLMRFESLGENCEFGLVQRRCGAEPLGLFRFASAPLSKLLAAIESRFEDFGAPENIAVELSSNGREYMVRDRRYGFLYHAWVMADEMRPEEIRERETRRLPLLIRKLIEDLAAARKLLVVRGMDQRLEQGHVEQLLAAVRQYGPNTVLWVDLADAEHPPSSVAWIGDNLLKGYIDRFAPGANAHDLSLDCWVAICREAYRLWQQREPEQPAAAAE